MKIGIINYGVGNLKSLSNIFSYIGFSVDLISNPIEIKKYDKIILPGVGSFKHCMEEIQKLNFKDEIVNFVDKEKYILGICVGMQLLCKSSTEDKLTKGFNFFDYEIKKFNSSEVKKNPVPHVGFNTVYFDNNSKIFKNKKGKMDFYFTHSYRLKIDNPPSEFSFFEYGDKFISSIEMNNILGVQFHPEKSQVNGIKLIYNFINL